MAKKGKIKKIVTETDGTESRTHAARPPHIFVYCRFQFEGFHHWKDAPDEFDYLRSPHRHMFHVQAAMQVLGTDRDVEFIDMKQYMQKQAEERFGGKRSKDVVKASCEKMASWLLQALAEFCDAHKGAEPAFVDVSEDGENGARVCYL